MPGMSPKIKAKKGRFGVGGLVPTIAILSPASGHSVAANGSPVVNAIVTFRGQAFDDAGDVSSSIAWSSDIDGALGTGKTLTTDLSANVGSPLQDQVHVITATFDDGTNVVTDTITVTVTP